jgi:hypothetical protein
MQYPAPWRKGAIAARYSSDADAFDAASKRE